MSTQNTPMDWKRPYFSQAAEPNLIYFIVFGKAIAEMKIPGDQYHVHHMPEGLNLSTHHQESDPETLNMFRNDMFMGMLQQQHPELVDQVQALDHCYVLQAVLPDQDHLNGFQTSIGIITYLLDSGAVAVLDPAAYYWWTPNEWREKVFSPEKFDPFAHVKIYISSEHNESKWVYTHGMRKFGRPDLSIHYVNEEEMDAVIEMVNRFISFMAHGGVINEGQEIQMHDLPQGMLCHHRNTINDPNFNNNHVEITWPDPDQN